LWTALKGEIPTGHEINHINGIKIDNRLVNLECVTRKEHGEKTREILNNIGKNAHKNRRNILSIDLNDPVVPSEFLVFKNKNQVAKYYGCSPSLIYHICEGRIKCLDKRYTFTYTDKEPTYLFPDARIGKKNAQKILMIYRLLKER